VCDPLIVEDHNAGTFGNSDFRRSVDIVEDIYRLVTLKVLFM